MRMLSVLVSRMRQTCSACAGSFAGGAGCGMSIAMRSLENAEIAMSVSSASAALSCTSIWILSASGSVRAVISLGVMVSVGSAPSIVPADARTMRKATTTLRNPDPIPTLSALRAGLRTRRRPYRMRILQKIE